MLTKVKSFARAALNKNALRISRTLEKHAGYHLIRRHYYSPVPDPDDIPEGYWDQKFSMPGVDMGYERSLAFLRDVVPQHIEAFRREFPLHRKPEHQFFLINGSYMAVDAHVYWCMINHHKPRRIIEIGGGASTMVAAGAMAHLRDNTGHEAALEIIEPYPTTDFLRNENGKLLTLRVSKVQDVPLEVFESLEANDILFIDSTHVLREASDCQFEYLEILPRLKPGVLVHIHDISLPEPYPKVYFDTQVFWNEQYLLQAFLAFNSRFEVIWPGNGMMVEYPEVMLATFPEINDMRAVYPQSEPTAFWMRVVGG